jgi:hypothetical protein
MNEVVSSKYVVSRISWKSVADEINRRGKPYTPQYIRDVAHGYRSNRYLSELLKQLGIGKKIPLGIINAASCIPKEA